MYCYRCKREGRGESREHEEEMRQAGGGFVLDHAGICWECREADLEPLKPYLEQTQLYAEMVMRRYVFEQTTEVSAALAFRDIVRAQTAVEFDVPEDAVDIDVRIEGDHLIADVTVRPGRGA